MENIKIEITNFPELEHLVNEVFMKLEFYGNMFNLFSDEPQERFPPVEQITTKYKVLLQFISFVEENYSYQIKFNHFDFTTKLSNTIKGFDDEAVPLDLLKIKIDEAKKEINNTFTLIDIFPSYLFSWLNYSNHRVLNILYKKHRIPLYKNLLSLTILEELQFLESCTSLESFLNPLLDKYYHGYLIGNKVFKNMFYSRIRVYIKYHNRKSKIDNTLINEFMKVALDTDLMSETSNKNFLFQAFNSLCKYTRHRFEENKVSQSETYIYIYYTKIIGLTWLIRRMYSEFKVLHGNILYSFQKDFFEEIHCDCGALSLTSKHWNEMTAPSYIHWILLPAISSPDGFNREKFNSFLNSRNFISKGLLEVVDREASNKEFISEKFQKDVYEIAINEFSTLKYRFVVPFYEVLGYEYKYLTTSHWQKEFQDYYLDIQLRFNITDTDFDLYSKGFADDYSFESYNPDVKMKLLNAHKFISTNEVLKAIEVSGSESNTYENKKEYLEKIISKIPYHGALHQELAILLDENGKSKEAFYAICEAILLEPTDELKWQSLFIILDKL